MSRTFLLLAGVLGFLAVLLGAFGAHFMVGVFAAFDDGAQRMSWWQTGVSYHLGHALLLAIIGALSSQNPSTALRVAGWSCAVGIVLFSGSLYALALSGVHML